MLLAIDVGNTQTQAGVYSGEELLHEWRLAPSARRPPTSSPPTTTRSCACAAAASASSTRWWWRPSCPTLSAAYALAVAQVPAPRGPGDRPGRPHRRAAGHRQPARAGRRPHRQRGRRLPPPRRPVHRRGLRHRHDVRRRLRRRRVPGRRHRPGHRDVPRRPHQPGRPPGEGRPGRPGPRDRQVDHREHAVGHRLRDGRDGRRRVRAHEGRARARTPSSSPPAASRRWCSRTRSRSTRSTRCSRWRACAWCTSSTSASRPPPGRRGEEAHAGRARRPRPARRGGGRARRGPRPWPSRGRSAGVRFGEPPGAGAPRGHRQLGVPEPVPPPRGRADGVGDDRELRHPLRQPQDARDARPSSPDEHPVGGAGLRRRPRRDGRGRPRGRGGGRRHGRRQHGLPRPEDLQDGRGRRAAARPGARRRDRRGDGPGGGHPGDREDAPRA